MAIFKENLISSGEKARLKELLHSRLTECGWKQGVTDCCHAVVRQQGLEKTTVDLLVQQSVKLGRDTVPQHIKQEMTEVRPPTGH
jgi:enhancer of yellow 2 transcription factor